jgi:fatty acid desaturase
VGEDGARGKEVAVQDRHELEDEQPESQQAISDRRRRDARLVVAGILAVFGIWFAVANLQQVTVHFWVVSARTSLVTALAIAAAFGAGVWALAVRRYRRSRS